jgi:DNA-binding response OmpR family regulator
MDKGLVVLLVEGEVLFGKEHILNVLSASGFTVRTVKMVDAEKSLRCQKPALMIANLSAADSTGVDDCLRLVRWSAAPLIAIGPAGEDAFRTAILEAAADDYLNRPVNPQELAVRAKNILLRIHPRSDQGDLKVKNPVGASLSSTIPAAGQVWMKRINECLCRIFKGHKV